MSEGVLEIRVMQFLDGSSKPMYRIGSGEWTEITHFQKSVLFEQPDGTFTWQYSFVPGFS